MQNTNIELKIYAFGLNLIHDPNWTGIDLFEKTKQYIRGRIEPKNLLRETIKNGFLFHLGLWFHNEYFDTSNLDDKKFIPNDEYLFWYAYDLLEYLQKTEDSKTNQYLELQKIINESDFDWDEENGEKKYYAYLKRHSNKVNTLCKDILDRAGSILKEIGPKYADSIAERAFHDRNLCEYLSKLLIEIGFDGRGPKDTFPKKWVNRKKPPEWAKRAIIARDRGHCALCHKNLIMELEDGYHFDHIIPLEKAGTNDLVNWQLLCQKCNLSKSDKDISVKSSIPKYLQNKN